MSSIIVRGTKVMSEWVDGLKSPGGPLAQRSESTPEAFGHAVRNAAEGAGVGAAVGILTALKPGLITPAHMGIGAIATAALGAYTGNRSASNASVALAALGARDVAQSMTAAKAGTTTQVAAAHNAQLAAHGESHGPGMGAEDPVIAYGAKTFAQST